MNKACVTKFMIYDITTYLFDARHNLNPSRPCPGLLKVDWYLYPPIFVAREVISIIRVRFQVVFFSTGVVRFCWLLISLTQSNQENSIWSDRRTKQHVCSTCCTIFKGWAIISNLWDQQHDGGFVGHYSHLTTYKHT